MKKILIFTLLVTSIYLTSCSNENKEEETKVEQIDPTLIKGNYWIENKVEYLDGNQNLIQIKPIQELCLPDRIKFSDTFESLNYFRNPDTDNCDPSDFYHKYSFNKNFIVFSNGDDTWEEEVTKLTTKELEIFVKVDYSDINEVELQKTRFIRKHYYKANF